jgi:vanillate O-demethylase ferredoxin subunit
VRQVTYQAIGINSYELTREDGGELPPFSPGSHIDVHSGYGHVRQYSLCNDSDERRRYVIAVLRQENGLGGSIAIHDHMFPPRSVTVGLPRNNFQLVEGARRYLLVAGGIGVTPLKAMVHRLERSGAKYVLHYCARSPSHAAFLDEMASLSAKGRVVMHYDGGDPAKGLDIADLLRHPEEGDALYYCGPPAFMTACAQASAHWPPGTVHCEFFARPALSSDLQAGADSDSGPANAFRVRIASDGRLIDVPGDKSLARTLAENGLMVSTSCESGLCGACKVRYLSGEVDHRDFVLTERERLEYLTTCVSRGKGGVVELDL